MSKRVWRGNLWRHVARHLSTIRIRRITVLLVLWVLRVLCLVLNWMLSWVLRWVLL